MTARLGDLRAAFPLLKMVTGEMFEKEHWAALFHRLRFPSDTSVQTLTLGTLVRAAPLLVQVRWLWPIHDMACRCEAAKEYIMFLLDDELHMFLFQSRCLV
jgi:hypothetical protein